MSIPKEPRQLMINIMYLVLTALLALNVSAEIFNAFKVVDKGLEHSSDAYDAANGALPALIRTGAKKKAELQQYADRIDDVRSTSSDLSDYIDGIIDHMIDQTGDKNGEADGGDYIEFAGLTELKGKKDKDITTRYLVKGGVGEELKQKLNDARTQFLSFVDTADRAATNIPLEVDDATWQQAKKNKRKKTWAEFNFNHMPLQAALPILNKFKNDAKASEGELLKYLANKVGTTTDVVLDKYIVISSPKKSYIIKGERYETELSLGAASSASSNTKVAISVNGKNLPVNKDGVAKWSATASRVGVQKYNAVARITNPATDETTTVKREYEFEVGERSVTVSASKMNVFYIGVPNPVEISAAGVASNKVNVSMSGGGGTIKRNSDGTYTVNVTKPTPNGSFAKVSVSADGLNVSKDFRVKPIPDPVAMLGGKDGGTMGSGEFKAQQGVAAILKNFDFDARCRIVGFGIVRAAPRQDAQIAGNVGAKYGAEAQRIVNAVKPGDRYFFENVKAKCPGDPVARKINDMVFKIK